MKRLIKKAAIGMVAFFVLQQVDLYLRQLVTKGLTGQNITKLTVILAMLMINLLLAKSEELTVVHSWTKPLIQRK